MSEDYSTFKIDGVLKKFIQKYVSRMEIEAEELKDGLYRYEIECAVSTPFEPTLTFSFPEIPAEVVFFNLKQLKSIRGSSIKTETTDDTLKAEVDLSESGSVSTIFG